MRGAWLGSGLVAALMAASPAQAQSDDLVVPEIFAREARSDGGSERARARSRRSDLRVPEIFRRPAEWGGRPSRRGVSPDLRIPDGFERGGAELAARSTRAPSPELRVPDIFRVDGAPARVVEPPEPDRPLTEGEAARPIAALIAEAGAHPRYDSARVGPFWIPREELCDARAAHGDDAPVARLVEEWDTPERALHLRPPLAVPSMFRWDGCPAAPAPARALDPPSPRPARRAAPAAPPASPWAPEPRRELDAP